MSPARTHTPELLAKVRALASRGMSATEIGAQLGVEPRTVQQWMTRYDIPSGFEYERSTTHGTTTQYNYGCHCPLCTAAHSERGRQRRAQIRAWDAARPHPRAGLPWETWEDKIITTPDLPITVAAERIGRTHAAVRIRRGILYAARRAEEMNR